MSDAKRLKVLKDKSVKYPDNVQVQPTVQSTATLLAQTLNMRIVLLVLFVTVTGTTLGYIGSNINLKYQSLEDIFSNVKALIATLLALRFTDMTAALLRRNFLWVEYYSERLRKLEVEVTRRVLFPMFSGDGAQESPVTDKNDMRFEENVQENIQLITMVWLGLFYLIILLITIQFFFSKLVLN